MDNTTAKTTTTAATTEAAPAPEKTLKQRGADAAVRFLSRRGYDILARDYKGLDIVCKDGDILVFVRVETSTTQAAFAEVDNQLLLPTFERAAVDYIVEHAGDLGEQVVRFDRVGVCVCGDNRALLKHHVNAFREGVTPR